MLAVPLLIGDVDMTAIGTCTEVLNGRVFGFGHPFMSCEAVGVRLAHEVQRRDLHQV